MDENKTPTSNSANSTYAIPGAIIIAGLIIASAIYYQGPTANPSGQPAAAGSEAANPQLNLIKPVSANDHIVGNPKAPIKIIEYSDLECPFCKTFHATMHQVAESYPNDVAWVYRHFPLDQLHSKARHEAEATECAFELGGHDKFWAMTDQIFKVTPSNDKLDPAQLPLIAEQIGLNKTAFESCLASGRQAIKVDADYQNAVDAGGRGTPFPVVIMPDGKRIALQGAVPFEGMKQLIDAMLKAK